MAFVYAHIRPDNDTIFYIGIGKRKNRPYTKHGRNNYWNNIVQKCNGEFKVVILDENISWEEACEKEKYYIKHYGRSNIGTGNLCNLTDGGEGILNLQHTDQAKLKISIATKNRHKEKQHCRKGKRFVNTNSRKVVIINLKTYIIYNFNTLVEAGLFLNVSSSKVRRACVVDKSINDYYLKFGDNFTKNELNDLKNKCVYDLSAKNINKDYSYLKRKVVNTTTNEIFESISEVSKIYGITNSTLNRQLRNVSKNKTVFKLL